MRWTRVIVTGALLMVVGCSKSSTNQANVANATKVDRSTAIAVGDQLCQQLSADFRTLVDPFHAQHPTPTKEEAHDFVVSTIIPRDERFVGDFHRIGEPTNGRADWDDLVKALDNDLAAYKARVDADPIGSISFRLFADRAAAFANYGFKNCQDALS